MKKLMIAAAIVCAAAMSQAASFTWNSTALFYSDTKANDGVKQTAALTAPNAIVVVYLGTSADWENASAANIVSSSQGTYSKGGGPFPESFTAGSTVYQDANFKVGSYYGVMFYDGENLSRLVDYNTGATLDTAVSIASWDGTDQGVVTLSNGSAKFAYANAAYAPMVQDVPEPTSAMLLLLGVAGLALRRKQK